MKKFKHITALIAIFILFNSIFVYALPHDKGKIDNIAPTIDLNVTPEKKPVDIVILTDYTGTKLTTLNTQIKALKAQFSAVNVQPVFHLISDMKKIGTQSDELYWYRRYARFSCISSVHEWWSNWDQRGWKANERIDKTLLWEQKQALGKMPDALPSRNPTNVRFTMSKILSTIGYVDGDPYNNYYYNAYIYCNNDVKTSGTIEVDWGNNQSKADHYESYGAMSQESVSIDSQWTREEKIQDVNYDIYSLDFSKLNNISLRAGSDRHMIFLSDGAVKDYSKTQGEYFSFGDLTEAVKSYIETNNFSLYGVAPEYARGRTLLPDKVAKVLPVGGTTLFYMENGQVLKDVLVGGVKSFPEAGNIGAIKEVITKNNFAYLIMENGTIKYYDTVSNSFATIEGIPDVAKVYNFNNGNNLYVLDSSGQVYYIGGNTVEPFNNSVVISDIFPGNIYVTSDGVPYTEYHTYNYNTRVQVNHLLRRARIMNSETRAIRNLPNIKGFASFSRSNLSSFVSLYKTGQIQQFTRMFNEYTSSSNGDIAISETFLLENTMYSVLETNVERIDSNGNCIFIFKNDGTIKQLKFDWGVDSDGDEIPVFRNTTVDVPLSNIQKTISTGMERYFFIDNNNNTYMYATNIYEDYTAPTPVMGTTLKNMGNNIKKIAISLNTSGNGSSCVFLFYDDGTVGQLANYYTPRSKLNLWIQYNHSLLDDNDIKDISTSYNYAYLLKEDGSVLGRNNGSYVGFVNIFENPLTIDTSKSYLSLLDLFNEIPDNKFYAAGGYATAFNDIYKNYNYSTGGDMYVLLGDDIRYESAYSDYESDPEHSRKWKISHDPYHFDNSMGMSVYHNPVGFTASPPTKLDKAGKYVIDLNARDNPKNNLAFLSDTNEDRNYYKWSLGNANLTVYIHRKPIALQRISVTNNGNGTFTVKALDAGSYDPDHSNSRTDKGIIAREWRWRETTSTTWTAGQMNKSDCTPDESYITQLRVKDVEGVWSDYATVTIDKNNPPAALFNIDKRVINISELLKVKDQSYPQSLSDITQWHWVVKKLNADGSVPTGNIQNEQFTNSNAGTGTLEGFDSNVKTNYSSNGSGKYRIYLRVRDSNGLWSDGGTDSNIPADLTKYYSLDFEVDRTPIASFVIEKNPMYVEETLKLRDQSTAPGTSPLTKWHWIVKKLNPEDSVPSANIQDAMFSESNTGTGDMAGYDVNVKTMYEDKGPGIYRIYLRVMNGNGMWSDEGTDSSYNLNSMHFEDLEVRESFKLSGFRVVRIRDFHLEPYYNTDGKYPDRPFFVNSMAIDQTNFMAGGMNLIPGFSGLTKGYRFEFEIDSVNFNEADDTIVITPTFYPYISGVPGTRGTQADLYWKDSNKDMHKAGEGGHSSWAAITLDIGSRTITGEKEATWRGEYFIPATSWLVPLDTAITDAESSKLNSHIIVNFRIRGYCSGEMKYDYNLQQWPMERTEIKHPYEIGDVIRYDYTKSSLEDIDIIINRP